MEEVLIPCSGFVIFGLVMFGFVALMRYIAFRETIALADRGLVRGDRRGSDGKDTLRWGIITTAVGLALCLGLWPIGYMTGSRFILGLGPWMLVGLLPTFFGLGLVLIYVLTRDDNGNGRQSPPPPAAPPAADPTADFRDRPRE